MVVIILIIVMVSFVILLPIAKKIIDAGTMSGNVQACYVSVIGSALVREGTYSLSQLDLKCPREEHEFTTETSDQINSRIARNIADCMIKFGEGQIDFAGSGQIADFSKIACAICGSFSIPRTYEPSTWKPFLETRKHPGKGTYDTYFKQHSTADAFRLLSIYPPTPIPNKEYWVYLTISPKDLITDIGGKEAPLLNRLFGSNIGSDWLKQPAFITFRPSFQNTGCDYLLN